MNHKIYFITLKPTGAFYFGSEHNFSGGQNYFAVSRKTPQQSTLLGVLRYKLLEANSLLAKEYGRQLNGNAATKIGPQSFVNESLSDSKNYGAISHITAVSLFDGTNFFLRGHRDRGFGFKGDEALNHDFQLNIQNGIPLLRNFDIKTSYPTFWIGRDGVPQKEEDLFTPKTQVGIYRTVSRLSKRAGISVGDEDEKGFFKKNSWLMSKPGMAFSFFAYLDVSQGEKLAKFCVGSNGLTPVGGERSLFKMEVAEGADLFEKWKQTAARGLAKETAYNRAVLLSDAYVKSDDLYNHCSFALANPVPFRFMMTRIAETKNYFALEDAKSKGGQYLKKSPLFQLMEAGSVFYLSDEQVTEFELMIQSPKAFCQIGNNEYILYNCNNNHHLSTFKNKNNG